ncbi:MAG: O-succinylhomoserine sulfhydrylase, partial [Ornithinibacter sp.]
MSAADKGWRPQTLAVRGGLARSGFDETAEALYLTSGFVYQSAEEAEAAFKGEVEHYIYSRYGNPTVSAFEERMRLLEGAEACFATASGMAAVFTSLAALVGAGDRVVASRALFGSCFVILEEILPRWGVETVFVDGADLEQWREALSVPTAAVFFETPSNPMQELVDIAAVSDLAHAAGARVVVDNVFGTPVFSHPLAHGADIVVYSATKHIDGQGRALGGAILGPKEFIEGPVKNLMRHTGPAMSPFNAWIMTKGLETLDLRVRAMAASALLVAQTLEEWQGRGLGVQRVIFPHLPSHPQHQLALRQLEGGGGTVVTFDVVGGKEGAFAFLNALDIIDISNNLGDTKSLT